MLSTGTGQQGPGADLLLYGNQQLALDNHVLTVQAHRGGLRVYPPCVQMEQLGDTPFEGGKGLVLVRGRLGDHRTAREADD